MNRAADDLRKLDGRQTVANADAAMIVAALAAVSVPLSVEAANRIAALIAALLTELGGGLFLSVAVALLQTPRTSIPAKVALSDPSCPVECPVDVKPVAAVVAGDPALPVSGVLAGSGEAPDGRASERIIRELVARSGVLLGSQRAMAQALGLSKSRTGEALNALAASGRVRLTVTPKGSIVQLVSA